MRTLLGLSALLSVLTLALAQPANPPTPPVVSGLKDARAAVVGPGGKVYVAAGKDVLVVEDGKAKPFATGLDAPAGLASFGEALYVADRDRIQRIDAKGQVKVHAAPEAFPTRPTELVAVVAAEVGNLYALDRDDKAGTFAIYRIPPGGKGKAVLVADGTKTPAVKRPRAIAMDGSSFLLVLAEDKLHRVKVADGSSAEVASGLLDAGSLAWDWFGRLYIGHLKPGEVSVLGRPGDKPVVAAKGFNSVHAVAMGPGSRTMLVVTDGAVSQFPVGDPANPVEVTPLAIKTEVAFPNLKWTDWKSEDAAGKPIPLRPIVLTHANDGSGRVFVATQHGVIHHFPNVQNADKTTVFLDLQDRVKYDDKQNEEGFLGLAFHPKFKENGEFFVYYTRKTPNLTNIVSRFRVRKDDPSKADPASEEELLRMAKPYWNHDGGTIAFGPDGMLYIAVGDGGAANDPHNNGQNLNTLLGKILRIDVNAKDAGKAYAIPQDNPFVGKEGARPEIWAYGVRNPWRIHFDTKTGKLWMGEVGQNLYEEICIITRGGNYGWNLRESYHPFGVQGVPHRPDLVEPIWEYHHDLGKSITGGPVYRGKRLPELDGAYLYADYVSSKIWALWYDEAKGRVVANRPIQDPGLAVLSFGEGPDGDVYFLVATPTGQGIHRFARAGR